MGEDLSSDFLLLTNQSRDVDDDNTTVSDTFALFCEAYAAKVHGCLRSLNYRACCDWSEWRFTLHSYFTVATAIVANVLIHY